MRTEQEEKQLQNVSKKATEKAVNVLSQGELYAIGLVKANIFNGAFWGFTTVDDVMDYEDVIKENRDKFSCHKLSDGVIVEVNPNYLLSAVTRVDNALINMNDVNAMKTAMAEAEVAFKKFLLRKGKDENGKALTIGIYCTNDVTSITLDGVSYPAFRVPVGTFLMYCNQLGYSIRLGNTLVDAKTATAKLAEFFNTCKVSPTKTGIFTQIQSTQPVDFYEKVAKANKKN